MTFMLLNIQTFLSLIPRLEAEVAHFLLSVSRWPELDMEQQTGSKLGKEEEKAVYHHLPYLTYMESA